MLPILRFLGCQISFWLKISLVVFVLFMLSNTLSAQEKVFDQANQLYNDEKYEQAIEKYQAILNAKFESPELYYNLGNAYAKLDELGEAIYYLEKAKKMKPDDEDIQNNLAFVQNKVIDDITPLPKIGLSAFLDKTSTLLNVNQWAKFAVGMSLLFALMFLLYYFTYHSLLKRIFFTGILLSIFLFSGSMYFAFHQDNYLKDNQEAIVFSSEVTVKSEPLDNSENIFLLHEGTKVFVLETVDSWKKIKLADGKLGWIKGDKIRILWFDKIHVNETILKVNYFLNFNLKQILSFNVSIFANYEISLILTANYFFDFYNATRFGEPHW